MDSDPQHVDRGPDRARRDGPAAGVWPRGRSWLVCADARARALCAGLGHRAPVDAIDDRRGRCVRDVPRRCTFEAETDGVRWFRKLREGRVGDARREWRALHRLAALGLEVPEPLFAVRDGARTLVAMRAVPGRSLLELLERGPLDARARTFLVDEVAARVRRLHRAGLVHRDLYWNHWFAIALDPAAGPPALIDVERVFRPLWRRRRWIVKDLAGLVATWPERLRARTLGLRFLRAYSGGRLPEDWRRLAAAVLQKAAQIRSHRPRHGSPPPWAAGPGQPGRRGGEDVRSP